MPQYKGYFQLSTSSKQQAIQTSTTLKHFIMQKLKLDDMNYTMRALAILHGMPSSTIWDDYKYHPLEAQAAVKKSIQVLQDPGYGLLDEQEKKRVLYLLQFVEAIMGRDFPHDENFIKLVKQMCPID